MVYSFTIRIHHHPIATLITSITQAKILVFCGGKCVIAGCRNRADLARAWAAVKIMVSPYTWTTADGGVAPTHTATTAKRVASRKDKH